MSDEKPKSSFEQAGQEKQTSLVGEFIQFLGQNKKFWLIPLLAILLLLSVLLILGGTAAAPFIYTLF